MARSAASPKVLVVAGAKGGTGKTTSAAALAWLYAEAGARVILLDYDPQASATATFHLDVVLEPASPLDRPPVPILRLDGREGGELRIVRGGRALERVGEREADACLARAGAAADLVVVDTVPALQPSVRAALARSDVLLVPLEAEFLAARGLGEMRGVLDAAAPAARLRAVLTRYRPGLRLTREIEAAVEETYPGTLCAARIPLDVRCAEAPGAGLPVPAYAPRSRAASAYRSLAAELAADLGLPPFAVRAPAGEVTRG